MVNKEIALGKTQFNFSQQKARYEGKVRDVYHIGADRLAIVASDRISAFDHLLPSDIPYKGEMLNLIAAHFLRSTADIVENWLLDIPHPAVAYGKKAEAIPLEMVIRGYCVGHAWREYKQGKRILCGEALPEGLKENQKFAQPIITPATKAASGHDEDISKTEILQQKIVSPEIYQQLERITHALYQRGVEMAEKMGLLLVDTKYEFGLYEGRIILIDEVHTPDSSRYFYADSYQENFNNSTAQKHLSKEFVREWLISEGFQGLEGQQMPPMPEERVAIIQNRYLELYQIIMGKSFVKTNRENLSDDIYNAVESLIVR